MAIGSPSTRLVVVRGNSGSGKSSVATSIRAARPAGTLAVVAQDTVRADVLGTGSDMGGHASGLVDLAARYLLERGLDVVIEGVLDPVWYADPLRRLVADHRGSSRAYVYDLTFGETLRRHATKPVAHAFGEPEMRRWWRDLRPVPGLDEEVIGPDESLQDTVRRILDDCWPERHDRRHGAAGLVAGPPGPRTGK